MHVIDIRFSLGGGVIPVDHGYPLFSAISKIVPELHGAHEIGIHPISGMLCGNRSLLLNERSCLTIRAPSERAGLLMPLAGKSLRLGEREIRVGVPYARALLPSSELYSPLVVIKGFMEPELFLTAVRRQLDALDIKGIPHLVHQPQIVEANRNRSGGTRSPFLRRTVRIHDKEIVGFAVKVDHLTAEESLLLQERGIGGRRRFGCGLFVPIGRK